MALASDIDFSVDAIQRNILDDTDGILEFLNDINAKAPRNSKFICDEIIGSRLRNSRTPFILHFIFYFFTRNSRFLLGDY